MPRAFDKAAVLFDPRGLRAKPLAMARLQPA
jgi:hypothetical protein